MLFHIIGADEWEIAKAAGEYQPAGLASEGFIHLSRKEQILRPANLLYQGRVDLSLLVIDPSSVHHEVVFEPGSHGETEDFPHLYGPLNVDAVVDVVPFPWNGDGGRFVLPEGLPD